MIDEVGKIIDHVLEHVYPSGNLKAQHGEVAVPIINLAKPSAWDNVGEWQGYQRAFLVVGFAGKDIPQRFNMLADRFGYITYIAGRIRFGQVKIRRHKFFQIKTGIALHF